MSERQGTDWTTPRLHSRPSSPAAATGETLNPEDARCRRGQVQRLVRRAFARAAGPTEPPWPETPAAARTPDTAQRTTTIATNRPGTGGPRPATTSHSG